jgi:hypothetical protein
MTVFDEFCNELTGIFRGLCTGATHRSLAAKREKLWAAFHRIRFSTVACIWEKFLSTHGVFYDRFSVQSVSQKLFEKIILREFSQSLEPAASSVSPSFESLSKDELNVLQYACGYVPQHFY